MAARLIFIVASLCYVAIFVQESAGSCIRSGGLPNNLQLCMYGERSAPESSLDCSPVSRNSARDRYASSYDDRSQISRSNDIRVAAGPRKKCPMYNYALQTPSDCATEPPCKAYGVMVAVPKPLPKASFVSTSHQYQVEKVERKERVEQQRAYGVSVAVPRIAAARPRPEVAYDYAVERPKQPKPEDRYAYGVAVVKVAEPEPCLPCMEDDNIPNEGFYEPPAPCHICVDDPAAPLAQEPRPVSLPRSGGCRSCARCNGAQAGGYYYENSRRKSSSKSSSCQSYEQRYEGRRDGQAASHVAFVPLQSVRESSRSRSHIYGLLGDNSEEDMSDYHSSSEEDNDSEYERKDSRSMGCVERSGYSGEECGRSEPDKSDEYRESSSEEDMENSDEFLRSGTESFYRPSSYFQGSTSGEDREDTSCESSMAHSRFSPMRPAMMTYRAHKSSHSSQDQQCQDILIRSGGQ